MTEFRSVTTEFSVSPQIALADVARAKALGFALVINNRPEGESPDQPPAADIEAATRAAGLDYLHIPVVGRPTLEQAAAVATAAEGRRTLAFCRSGARSIMAWALGELAAGAKSRGELVALAADAGYDLSAALPG
jgi:uncharacterized protein (TIGR01244 family)